MKLLALILLVTLPACTTTGAEPLRIQQRY
jgi:hypothetical protein